MIYAKPGKSFEAVLDNAPAGLVGTVGVAIINTKPTPATVVTARTTVGIAENPAGSGFYDAALTAPTEATDDDHAYSIIWDTGGATPARAREELRVVSNPPTIPSESGYCSPDDVRNALAPDGDPDGSLGTAASLSDDQLDSAIADGASEINAKLASRFSVPFAGAVPVAIVKINADIAAYLATLTHRRGQPIPDDDPVRLRYSRALTLLTALAKGEAGLLGEDGPVAETEGAEAAVFNRYEGELFGLEDFGLVKSNDLGRRWPVG